MLFSWADANLDQYWEKIKLPKFTRGSLLWMLKQCKDLAFAIDCMHNYKSREHFKAVDLKQKGLDLTPSTNFGEPGKETDFVFAQHGDIKPANILWTHNRERGDPQGQLMIADFGLSAFHKEDAKSKIQGPHGFHTYSPPECALKSTTSLQYDIWSLGVVFLCFITWMSLGYDGLEDFSDRLLEPDKRFPEADVVVDALFYIRVIEDIETGTKIKETGTKTEETETKTKETGTKIKKPFVKTGVETWISELRVRARFCSMLDEFLDLIYKKMLLTTPQDRISSSKLYEKLHSMYGQAAYLGDSNYLSPQTQVQLALRQEELALRQKELVLRQKELADQQEELPGQQEELVQAVPSGPAPQDGVDLPRNNSIFTECT
jgi:serine/threonine protein kinase